MDSQLPNPPLGTLSLLPPEIRDMVYAFVLAEDPVLRRVSKAVHRETESLVSKHGICRINIKYDPRVTWGLTLTHFSNGHWHEAFSHRSYYPKIDPVNLVRIQNVKFNVDTVEPQPQRPWDPSFPEIIQRLVSPMVTRKHCHLVFVLAEVYEICPAYEPQIARSFGFIQGFELVTLELRERPWVHDTSSLTDRKGILMNDAYGVEVLKEELFDCGLVRNNGAGSRVKIIRGAAGGNDGEVLWDSHDNGYQEPT